MPLKFFPLDPPLKMRAGEVQQPLQSANKEEKIKVNEIEPYLERMAKYYQPAGAVAFDYDNATKVGSGKLEFIDLFTVSRGFRMAVVRGIGLMCTDANGYTKCRIQWVINRQPIADYIMSRGSKLISTYDYANPKEVYIEIPKNSTFSLAVYNSSTASDWFIWYARATGWYIRE